MDEASLRPYREYHARRERDLKKNPDAVRRAERFLILEREIQKDLETIEELYEALGNPVLNEAVPPRESILA